MASKPRTGVPCYQHESYDPTCSDCYHNESSGVVAETKPKPDESRERFLDWWRENWPDLAPTHQALHAYFQAERDTREQCAQEHTRFMRNLSSALHKVLSPGLMADLIAACNPLEAFLREIGEPEAAERLRKGL